MADLRAKRIRAGPIIILVSVVAMLVLAGFTHISPYDYEPKSFMDRISHMELRRKGTFVDPYAGPIPVSVAFLQYKWIFGFGMTGVGIGAILLIVGLTTKAGKP